MNNNVQIFMDYLERENLNADKVDGDDLCMVVLPAQIESGPTARIMCFFANDDSPFVFVEAWGYVKIDNPMKKEYMLEKLNDLNRRYDIVKFLLSEKGDVIVRMTYQFESFDPDKLMGVVFFVYNVLKDEYKGFMKLIWG